MRALVHTLTRRFDFSRESVFLERAERGFGRGIGREILRGGKDSVKTTRNEMEACIIPQICAGRMEKSDSTNCLFFHFTTVYRWYDFIR